MILGFVARFDVLKENNEAGRAAAGNPQTPKCLAYCTAAAQVSRKHCAISHCELHSFLTILCFIGRGKAFVVADHRQNVISVHD